MEGHNISHGCGNEGGLLLSNNFVIPYPPGFPVLVPGQIISTEILDFLLAFDVTEIHGYRADQGCACSRRAR